MSLLKKFGPHLPYLRRYARALSGSQVDGDRYVEATLEAMVAEPGIIDLEAPGKLELFRIFSKIWCNISADVPAGEAANKDLARLDTLTPLPRQAFLLLSFEFFEPSEVATVLDIDEAKVGELVDEVGEQIADQVVSRVLIIEDEPLIMMDLKSLMEGLGHEVTGTAQTHEDAVKVAETARPQIILADIQLADGSSGIDAVNEILQHYEVPVLFITAFPERLLTGERPEPTYLIPKPFKPEMVKALVSQALFFGEKAKSGTILDSANS